MSKRYEGVLFDLDGTLTDSLESLAYSCNCGLEDCGLEPRPISAYRYYAGDGPTELVRRALADAGDQEGKYHEKVLQIYQDTLISHCTYHVKAYEGLKGVLDKMKAEGTKLAVVTNKPHKRAITVVETVFGKGYFDCIVGSGIGFERKPHPAQAVEAMKQLSLEPKQCMYVGDTDVDMKTGKAAGCYTVGVLWGFRTREELQKNHADAIAEKTEDLLMLWEG